MSFKEKMISFMRERYGSDALYLFLMVISMVLFMTFGILNTGFRDIVYLNIISYIALGLFFFTFFFGIYRFYSKDINKRRRENDCFTGFFKAIGRFFRIRFRAIKERKTFIYKKCPHCKNYLRLKRIKGEHTVKCPRCNESFKIKVK